MAHNQTKLSRKAVLCAIGGGVAGILIPLGLAVYARVRHQPWDVKALIADVPLCILLCAAVGAIVGGNLFPHRERDD